MMPSGIKRLFSFASEAAPKNDDKSKNLSMTNKMSRLDENDPRYTTAARRLLNFIHDSWVNNHLCDTVIKVKTGEIHAHKLLLCAYSQAIVKECENFPKGNVVLLDLTDYPVETVLELLYFVYTTNISINEGNLVDVLRLSSELDIRDVVDQCESFMNQFNSKNALKFYEIATELNLDVAPKIQNYICKNFIEIMNGNEFVNLTPVKLRMIIADEKLCVSSELDIFRAVVRWIDHDRKNRKQLAAKLLAYVQFEKIEPEVLATQVEACTDLFDNPSCSRMLYSAMRYHALALSGSNLACASSTSQPHSQGRASPFFANNKQISEMTTISSMKLNPAYERRKTTTSSSMSHFGRTHEANRRSQTEFQPYLNLTSNHTANYEEPIRQVESVSSTSSRSGICCVRENNKPPGQHSCGLLICMGGMDIMGTNEAYPGKCMYQYREDLNEWSLLTMMNGYVHHHASAALAGKIYVIGGIVQNESGREEPGTATNEVKLLDTETSKWIKSSPLVETRSYISAAVYNDSIYVSGGEDQYNVKLDSIEKYDQAIDKWSIIGHMRGGAKIGVATCVYNGCLYLVGGYSPERVDGPVVTDVECLDLTSLKWIDCNPLNIPRCHANLVVSMNKMYLIGGRTATQTPPGGSRSTEMLSSMSSIAVYNYAQDVWIHLSDMIKPRLDCGAAALGSKIYIVGGMHTPNPSCLNLVECYDTETNSWHKNPSTLPYPAAGTSCVTL